MHTRSLFARLFPPPKYITLPSVGVDISDSSVKYVMLEPHDGGYTLKKWGDISVPEEAIVQGKLKNIPALAKILEEIRQICNTPYMRVSLPEEHAYLFQTNVKYNTSRKEIHDALEFHLEENVPLSPRDAFFDFDYVPTEANVAQAGERPVTVTVYAKDMVLEYIEACTLASCVPIALEIEPSAIARAVIREGSPSTHLILDFGKSRTGIGIVHKGMLMFTSTVDVGGQQLDASLKLSYPQADGAELIQLKNERGLLLFEGDALAREALMKPIESLKTEILARISYWNSRPDASSIESIILCGGIANLAGLPEFFSQELGIVTEQASVWKNIFLESDVIPPITKRYSYGYATALGLALASFKQDYE